MHKASTHERLHAPRCHPANAEHMLTEIAACVVDLICMNNRQKYNVAYLQIKDLPSPAFQDTDGPSTGTLVLVKHD